jgi:nicotinate phosphoribosyltransferase
MELDVSYSSDKYQYTMGKTFYDEGMEQQRAIFNMFFRQAPDNNNWAVVSGISEVLEMVQGLGNKDTAFFEKFLPGDNYAKFREFISKLKFTGDIYAMREGEIVFPGEPVIIVDAPLIEAQVLETPLLSIMNHQMAIATKASRVTRATSKPVSEFGSRRAHGPWAAIYGAKAAYIGGCSGSSNIVTADIFGTPASGTMAHSYVTSFGCSVNAEKTAFDKYIKSHYGEQLVLLIDTYDTLRCGIKNAIKSFKDNDITNEYKASYGIRLDSGDLAYLSVECRRMLDEAGLDKCKIFATNSLDEYIISDLERQNAAIDVYGVGDAIATSKHNPCFGNVYKLVQIGEDPVLKRSEDKSKIINPGFQVTYRIMQRGFFRGDVTCIRGDSMVKTLENLEEFTIRSEFDNTKTTHFKERDYNFKILQGKVMEKGIICSGYDSAAGAKEYYLTNLAYFNPTEKRIINPHYYKVDISDDLYDLKNRIIDSLIKEIREYE